MVAGIQHLMRHRVGVGLGARAELDEVGAHVGEILLELAFLAFLQLVRQGERVAAQLLDVLLVLQKRGKLLGLLDRHGADEDRLIAPVAIGDRLHDGGVFLLGRAVDLVVVIDAADRNVGRDLEDVEAVDVEELVGLGRGGAGHAGELLVQAEVVLEGDRGQRLVLGLDLDALLGLESLVQAFRVAAAGHHAAGELVDDDDLAAFDDVVAIALEQLVRLQRRVDVMHERDVLDVVERALHQALLGQHDLDALVAGLGERHLPLLLVELEVFRAERRDDLVDGLVEVGAILQRTGDDERRARLVDEDRVHLVDDGERVAALDHLVHVHLHVVAQVVEAQLVVGAVGHVAGVGRLALLVVEAVHDLADGEAEERIDLAHPVGVALGEVIVDGDDVDALAGERVEIDGQRGDERLAFARLHLGDLALVQNHAADELHVEMALAEGALGGFAHGGEGGDEQIVDRGAFGKLPPEVLGTQLQLVVGEPRDVLFERVDGLNARIVSLDAPIVG